MAVVARERTRCHRPAPTRLETTMKTRDTRFHQAPGRWRALERRRIMAEHRRAINPRLIAVWSAADAFDDGAFRRRVLTDYGHGHFHTFLPWYHGVTPS